MPVATVIVPARDAAGTLGRTLAGLEAQDVHGEFEVLVVDDGSSDGTRRLASASPVVTRVLDSPGQGPAAARNHGAGAANAACFAFLDADCEPTPPWLAAGLRALQAADLVQGAVHPRPDVAIGPFDRTLRVTRAWGLFESANLFVTRAAFEQLGGFESWLVPADGKELGEDVWLGWRARRAGLVTAFAEEALVHHEVFSRGPAEYVAERARLRYFPALAKRIPELRDEFFYRRWFLNRRSASFDAAVCAATLAVLRRRPALLAGVLPYAVLVGREAVGWGLRRAPVVASTQVAADAVGGAALARGSVERRSLLL